MEFPVANRIWQYRLVFIAGSCQWETSISYLNATDPLNGDLNYIRANDVNGSSWGTSVTIDSNGEVGGYTSLAVINGRPAISYYDATNGDLKYAWANDPDGTNWAVPLTVDSEGHVGRWSTSLVQVNDKSGIAYYDVTNGDLKYMFGLPSFIFLPVVVK